jgi:hypothetical protein
MNARRPRRGAPAAGINTVEYLNTGFRCSGLFFTPESDHDRTGPGFDYDHYAIVIRLKNRNR